MGYCGLRKKAKIQLGEVIMSKFIEIVGQGISALVNVDEIKEVDFTITMKDGAGNIYKGARIVLQYPQAIGMGMYNYDIALPDEESFAKVSGKLKRALGRDNPEGPAYIELPEVPPIPGSETGIDGPA
jgi:hypothetical protein